jgi:hypothetical protein
MPFSPIDPPDPYHNPFALDKTRAAHAKAAQTSANQGQSARTTTSATATTSGKTAVTQANPLTVRASIAQSQATSKQTNQGFSITTQQIISLIMRFRLRSMTYAQLKNLPLSQLSQPEKDFVAYLRANPNMFERIARLDNQPGISVEDVKMASTLAGDSLVLSDEDLQYLQNLPVTRPAASTNQVQPDAFLANAQGLKTQDLINTLYRLNPQGLTFDQLMALRAEELNLEERERQSLRFLQSPTISKVLDRLVTPYDNMISPEVLRVLTSLIWNPAIYGSTPIVFFQTAPLAHEADIDPVAEINPITGSGKGVNRINQRARTLSKVERPKQVVHLQAQAIMDICHRLSPEGHVTLNQLRHYVPQTEAEEKALNLLRQAHIFKALAGMDEEPDYLDDTDIQLALAEGALVLSDPFIVVVILP